MKNAGYLLYGSYFKRKHTHTDGNGVVLRHPQGPRSMSLKPHVVPNLIHTVLFPIRTRLGHSVICKLGTVRD